VASKPPTIVDLVWAGRLEFAANLSQTAIVIDSKGHAGPSPVELLGAALAGCMSIDLAHILHRGLRSHVLRSLCGDTASAFATSPRPVHRTHIP